MTYQEAVSQIKETFMRADVSEHKGHLALQVHLTGEGEGILYAELNDSELKVEPYDYYDYDVAFTVDTADFLKIINGKLDPIFAFTIGKLKVDGDLDKALEIKNLIKSIK